MMHTPAHKAPSAGQVVNLEQPLAVAIDEFKSSIDFDSDAPLVCNRDQSGDTTCESCQ